MTKRLLPLLLLLALLPSVGRADVSATSPPIRHGTAASAPSAPLWTPYYASDTNRWYMVTPSGPSLVLGATGATGATGPQGVAGSTGATGGTGPTGATGAAGANGAAGSPGSVWYNGSGVPSAGVGINGDYDLDTATGNVYQKAAGTWGIVANIKGATGTAGATGSAGAAGSTGAAGTNGTNGSNGVGYTLGTASQTAHMNSGATAFVTDSGLLNNGAQLSVGGALDTATSFTMYAPSTSGVNLNLKLLSGQTTNPLNVSSSTGTGDLFHVEKDGKTFVSGPGSASSNTSVFKVASSTDANQFIGMGYQDSSTAGNFGIGYITANKSGSGYGALALQVANRGNVIIGSLSNAPAARLVVVATGFDTTTTRAIIAQGYNGQSTNLIEARDYLQNVMGAFAANGNVITPAAQTAIATKTSNYTLTATDTTILLNGTTLTATLPTNSAALAGHVWNIKELAASSGTIAGTIDGATNYTLTGQYSFVTIISDGSAYWVIAKG